MTRLFWLILLLSPGIWWLVIQPQAVVEQWAQIPVGVNRKVTSIFGPENLKPVEDMRWMSGSRLFFNKGTVLVKEGFDYLQYLAPRFYFLAGDGTNFSPSRVEPVPTVLFPFWLLGWGELIKRQRFRPAVAILLAAAVGYLSGIKNLAILWPVLAGYVYLATVGINSLGRLWRGWVYKGVMIYSLYLLGRAIWVS